MNYTISVTVNDEHYVRWIIIDQFSGDTWDQLWNQLGVTRDRWAEWQSVNGEATVISEFPILSRLAYIDEGLTSFCEPTGLEAECARALGRVRTCEVAKLLKSLTRAVASAFEQRGVVDVDPSTGEQAGDNLLTPLGAGTTGKRHLRHDEPLTRPTPYLAL